MTCITIAGTDYCDGMFTGFCPSEKSQVEFSGRVTLTDTGRVVARGTCSCRSPLEAALYTP